MSGHVSIEWRRRRVFAEGECAHRDRLGLRAFASQKRAYVDVAGAAEVVTARAGAVSP
ncbi:MAG: hypothetical protein U5K43_11650 [Halofilum sp. (in: g-proteobacteria)]|nr:hypothetical protein [Halofilum sp. (in: g-proteobacteria)]